MPFEKFVVFWTNFIFNRMCNFQVILIFFFVYFDFFSFRSIFMHTCDNKSNWGFTIGKESRQFFSSRSQISVQTQVQSRIHVALRFISTVGKSSLLFFGVAVFFLFGGFGSRHSILIVYWLLQLATSVNVCDQVFHFSVACTIQMECKFVRRRRKGK